MKMKLEDYISKYGVESGTKRYYGRQKILENRKKTYESHPYKRLTKEWFIWRYPEDGLKRFEDHVNKSRQSEENMIKRYGEELGKQKWQETLKKKNVVALLEQRGGTEAVNSWKEKRNKGFDNYWNNLSEDEKKDVIENRTNKAKLTKQKRYGNKTKLEIFKEKYGNSGSTEYAKYLQSIFKSVGYSKQCESFIYSLLQKYPILNNYTLYYRDGLRNKVEWFLTDNNNIYFYDFCIRELKIILEYDGSKWHPTYEQYMDNPDEIMEIMGITIKEKFERDQKKISLAEKKGFKIFKVRSDMSEDQINQVIDELMKEVNKNGRIFYFD